MEVSVAAGAAKGSECTLCGGGGSEDGVYGREGRMVGYIEAVGFEDKSIPISTGERKGAAKADIVVGAALNAQPVRSGAAYITDQVVIGAECGGVGGRRFERRNVDVRCGAERAGGGTFAELPVLARAADVTGVEVRLTGTGKWSCAAGVGDDERDAGGVREDGRKLESADDRTNEAIPAKRGVTFPEWNLPYTVDGDVSGMSVVVSERSRRSWL